MWDGLAAAPGIAHGPAVIIRTNHLQFAGREETVDDFKREKAVLSEAVEAVRRELELVKQQAQKELGKDQADIFTAQILMLDDPAFIGEASRLIEERKLIAAAAVNQVTADLSATLTALPDEYLRERAADIRDVGERLLTHLGAMTASEVILKEPSVLVGADIKPSQVARLPQEKLLALVSGAGGPSSHVAILARSLGIPAVLGIGEIAREIEDGDILAVDGTRGQVELNPAATELVRWLQIETEEKNEKDKLQSIGKLTNETIDGHRVRLMVNISGPADLKHPLIQLAEGVGLFRTEFIYMDKKELPGEEEQFEIYKEVVAFFAPYPVTIRTMDIGGDKDIAYLRLEREENPFLGLRSIRFSLAHPEIFRTQLRAILRAGAYGNVKVMFPMVSNTSEVRAARAHLDAAREELNSAGNEVVAAIEVGIMVEVPAAALTADILAAEVDFFSIGSNDLIQYTLAADRHNPAVAGLYEPFHPAVLRQIEGVVRAAHEAGIRVGICGEMAGDPVATPFLLGVGLDELSMSAPSVLRVKQALRSLSYAKAKELARKALALRDVCPTPELV